MSCVVEIRKPKSFEFVNKNLYYISQICNQYAIILTEQKSTDNSRIKHPDGCFQERVGGLISRREESYDTSVITHVPTSICLQ